jgi:ATP-dependent DNA helicase RecQ
VYRTGQVFGALHVVSVLRGEATEAVMRHGHDRLPTFGVGRAHAAPFWRGVVRQLIARGALDIDTDGHGGLFLVPDKARPILRGEARVLLRRADSPAAARRVRRAGMASAQEGEVPPALFEALRSWRAEQARAQSIPPYVIFHDSVLRDIAALRPDSLPALGEVKGVGASKLARYGAAVLRVLGTRDGGTMGSEEHDDTR